ncbi:MAG: methyltransferase type 11, partial [Burkholderiales bacterium]
MDINSTPYWDSRFATDWEERNGPAQTAFFAFVAASMLPEWLKADINARALSVNDLGCAEGSALPYLARIFD